MLNQAHFMDPLSRLLKTWRPTPPDPVAQPLVQAILRQIRQEGSQTSWLSLFRKWDEALDEWLPSPALLVPACGVLMLIATAFQWNKALEQAKEIAALRWQEEISRPFNTVSISGTFVRFNSDPASAGSPINKE